MEQRHPSAVDWAVIGRAVSERGLKDEIHYETSDLSLFRKFLPQPVR